MPAEATRCNAVLAREGGFGETADAEGFNAFLDLAGGAAGSGEGNLHTESYLPEQTAVDGLGRTDTIHQCRKRPFATVVQIARKQFGIGGWGRGGSHCYTLPRLTDACDRNFQPRKHKQQMR